jgi:hypothetical protein
MFEETIRQIGVTTQQMQQAPLGATFVWCNGHLQYPVLLAKKLGREDLIIRPMSWLSKPCNVMGHGLRHVIIDHAARLDDGAWESSYYLVRHGCNVA